MQVWSINYRRATERVWMSWWQRCHTLQESSGSSTVWIIHKADRGSWWVQEMLFSMVLAKENKMALTNPNWKPLVLIWHSTPPCQNRTGKWRWFNIAFLLPSTWAGWWAALSYGKAWPALHLPLWVTAGCCGHIVARFVMYFQAWSPSTRRFPRRLEGR